MTTNVFIPVLQEEPKEETRWSADQQTISVFYCHLLLSSLWLAVFVSRLQDIWIRNNNRTGPHPTTTPVFVHRQLWESSLSLRLLQDVVSLSFVLLFCELNNILIVVAALSKLNTEVVPEPAGSDWTAACSQEARHHPASRTDTSLRSGLCCRWFIKHIETYFCFVFMWVCCRAAKIQFFVKNVPKYFNIATPENVCPLTIQTEYSDTHTHHAVCSVSRWCICIYTSRVSSSC